MNINPIVAQGGLAAAIIVLVKATITLLAGLKVLTPEIATLLSDYFNTVIPVAAILIGAWWAAKRTTPLDKPTDVDGIPLTRPDNTPAIIEMQNLQTEAIKIDRVKTKELDRGLT